MSGASSHNRLRRACEEGSRRLSSQDKSEKRDILVSKIDSCVQFIIKKSSCMTCYFTLILKIGNVRNKHFFKNNVIFEIFWSLFSTFEDCVFEFKHKEFVPSGTYRRCRFTEIWLSLFFFFSNCFLPVCQKTYNLWIKMLVKWQNLCDFLKK